jgi:hypothetical protein
MPEDKEIIETAHRGSLAPQRGEGSRVRGENAQVVEHQIPLFRIVKRSDKKECLFPTAHAISLLTPDPLLVERRGRRVGIFQRISDIIPPADINQAQFHP